MWQVKLNIYSLDIWAVSKTMTICIVSHAGQATLHQPATITMRGIVSGRSISIML